MRAIPFLLLLALSGCGKPKLRTKRGDIVERLPRVEVKKPMRKDIERTLKLAATVEANKKVDLAARVPGIVAELADKMDIGRSVKKDEVLVRLAVPDLEADRAQKRAMVGQSKKALELAKEAKEVAKREVEEAEKDTRRLRAESLFSQQRLDRIKELVRQRAQDVMVQQEAERQYEAAAAALEANGARVLSRKARARAAESEVELAGERIAVAEADLKKAEALVSFAEVVSPFDGVLTRRSVDPGAVIKDSGTPLLTVMQVDKVRVLIDIPQRDAPLVDAEEDGTGGDPVELVLPMLAGKVKGTITRKSGALDPVTRTMRVEAIMDNPGRKMKPGMFGTATVTVEDRKDKLTVPASALVRRGEGDVEVFVVAEPKGEGEERRGVLRRVAVTLGIDNGTEVEITGGLKGDELVVTRGASLMRPDEEVLATEAP